MISTTRPSRDPPGGGVERKFTCGTRTLPKQSVRVSPQRWSDFLRVGLRLGGLWYSLKAMSAAFHTIGHGRWQRTIEANSPNTWEWPVETGRAVDLDLPRAKGHSNNLAAHHAPWRHFSR